MLKIIEYNPYIKNIMNMIQAAIIKDFVLFLRNFSSFSSLLLSTCFVVANSASNDSLLSRVICCVSFCSITLIRW